MNLKINVPNLKKPANGLFFKTFGAIVLAFVLVGVSFSIILKPVVKDEGFVVHSSVELLQDMLNAHLRGANFEEISRYLSNCHDEFLKNAQIATVEDLFSPQAPQKLGIILRGNEPFRILEGEAFWTGKPFGRGPAPFKTHFQIPDLIAPDMRLGMHPSNDPSHFGDRRRPEARFDTPRNRGSESPRRDRRPEPRPRWDRLGSHPRHFTIYSLVQYTATIMEEGKHDHIEDMRRASFMVIPIAQTQYVVFSRRLEPSPPQIAPQSFALAAGVLVVILLGTAVALILPIVMRIRKIENICQKVSQGDYNARCDDKRGDSLGVLAQHVDEMTISIQQHLVQQKSLLQAVSHELRTPLSRIRFTLEMLDIDENDEKSMARLDSIDEDLTEIDNLIKELGYFNYVDAGNGRQHFETVDLGELIKATLHQRSQAIEKFEVKVCGVTGDMLFEADPAAFKRVLGNLLSNASRYAKEKIEIHAAYDEEHKNIEVAVEDDGPGIPEDKRLSVFEPFVCLEASRSKSMTGCGLGLAIAHRIMKIHDGAIAVFDSELGGARMWTSWPISHE